MNFMKKQGIGFYLEAVTLIFTLVAIIAYAVNTGKPYFAAQGVSSAVVAFAICAILANLVLLVASQVIANKRVLDILYILIPVFLMLAFVFLVNARIYNIATIFTFENQGDLMQQLTSALVSLIFFFLAAIVGMVASAFKIVKA